ncbi:MAG: protein kinase [Cyanobacteria bacterium RM1_2_2]|nr:protein kinase [Cyanobacteria bacterium RM1_2_2]
MVIAGSELTPGTSVDRRYRIQCTLGRGGFGRTYLAADESRFGELCVLKEFVPSSEADPVVAQKLRELFQREAAILHQLDHPQIPKFFAGFEENNRLFIAQEYIDGKTYWRLLQERQRRGKAFNQFEIIEWLRDLLKVLDYLHAQNIVHRDISPDNIMLSRGQKAPVLIDFGVVKQMLPHLPVANPNDPDDLVQASVSVGKFGYAPYEQIRMGQCSPRSDLYALAVTAVVLLTGKPPNLLIDAKSLEWQWQSWVRLDPRLAKVLDMMMAEKPQDRYASAQIVLEDLQPLTRMLDRRVGRQVGQALNRRATQLSTLAAEAGLPSIKAVPIAQSQGWRTDTTPSKSADFQPLVEVETEASVLPWVPPSHEVTEHSTTQIDPFDAVESSFAGLPSSSEAFDQSSALSTSLTQIESGIIPAEQSLTWTSTTAAEVEPRPLSLSSLCRLIWASILQLPQDQRGNAKRPLPFSLKRLVVLGILALLPIGGAVVGARSPHIASLCWALDNCTDGKQATQEQYRQVVEQANSAGLLSSRARNLTDLQQSRQQLANAVVQLDAFSGTPVHAEAYRVLPKYQALLQTLEQKLEQETRAAQLLNRAEAEAQKAIEQTEVAKTLPQFQVAQVEWKRALATLAAIPSKTFVDNQVTARSQEYNARLGAISLKVEALTPKIAPDNQMVAALPKQAPSTTNQQRPNPIPASPSASVGAAAPVRSSPATSGAASPPKVATSARPTPRRASSPPARNLTRRAVPSTSPAPQPPQPYTSPLEIDSQWVAGSVITSATQTLSDVSIWIEGTRTEADGQFVATLMIANRSGRGFSFVPLYAESRDQGGNVVRSRVLFTGTADTTLEPGELLNGQISLLDRPPTSQRLTLVIQESTSGNRTFRIPF